MFNMYSVGKKIATLRKQKNMTQMEVADALNVTYQAVSNWERGSTMPDISKLEDLAQLLGVSIEDIITDKEASKKINDVRSDIGKLGIGDIVDIAPIMQPSEIERVIENHHNYETNDVIMLAPFLDSKTIKELLNNQVVSLDDLVNIAPFMDEEDLDEKINLSIENEELEVNKIVNLAPFIKETTLIKILEKVKENLDSKVICELIPFLNGDTINELCKNISLSNNELVELAPFLDSETIKNNLINYQFSSKTIVELAPFIDSSDLDEIVLKNKDQLDKETIVELAPFLEKATLLKII